MSLLALVLMVWMQICVPDFPGQATGKRRSLGRVFVMPGIRPILFVILAFVLSHNILYTYIAPFLARAGMVERTDLVLLIFGIASLLGIWIIGVLIDRHLRTLTLVSVLLFSITALALGVAGDVPVIVYAAAGIWGLAIGGAATLFQTALFKAAGDAADVAQSMAVTVWNMAIASGSLVGGVLLDRFGVGAFPPVLLALLMLTWLVVWISKRHSFPPSVS